MTKNMTTMCGALLSTACLLTATAGRASQAQVHKVAGQRDLLGGELYDASLDAAGTVRVGRALDVVTDALPGPVLALARGPDGAVYAATASPGRVFKIEKGKAPEQVWQSDKPLITALLSTSKGLVALTAPEGGAALIDPKSKTVQLVPTKDTKMLLGGAVLDDVVYAVGGGDEGAFLSWRPGDKAFAVLATTTEEKLRSVAARKVGGETMIAIGGSEDGVVYLYDGKAKKLRALVDTAPGEITSLAISDKGEVLFAATDGEGKLSKLATSKAKDDDEDDKGKKKKKARKVKSAELWAVDRDGRARPLWQSKDHGAYAVALDGGKLLAGTGPEGRVYAVDVRAAGNGPAAIVARAEGKDEITALLADNKGVLLGTAHGAAVLSMSQGAAPRGVYLSPVLDAEAHARYGTAAARTRGAAVKLSIRTGNTKEPDDTWSTYFADPSQAPHAQYAQIRAELTGAASLDELTLSYLADNRAPEVDRVEVLAPGWKVVQTQREPSETRSVTFSEKPFQKFLDRRGGQNPTLEERPFGKQSFDVGFRTVYAWVEDADKDALRYRFSLGKANNDGEVSSWEPLGPFSEAPFASFEASRYADGMYRVKVEVDDALTNGPARALGDSGTSPAFVVSHAPPRFVATSAQQAQKKNLADGSVHDVHMDQLVASLIKVSVTVDAALPLTVVRCAAAGGEWMPLDPKDGITDGTQETFEAELVAASGVAAASCEAYDEALSFARVDIPIR